VSALAIAAVAVLAIVAAALGYAIVALACVIAFGARRARFAAKVARQPEPGEPAAADLPAIAILKPVAGIEPGLFENLSSFCAQDYPQFQVVFGVAASTDPAAAVIADVTGVHPNVPIECAIGGARSAPNLKVGRLLNMMPLATHNILAVSDADTHVEREYLRALAHAFARESAGAVTCVYRGAPQAGGIASDLAAMQIDEQFIPSVLVAALGGVRFCLGATMAVRRKVLEAFGGFEAVGPYLADDQKLGEFAAAKGYDVVLAPYVIEHRVDEPDLPALWSHELRWARTARAARPLGYSGYFLTFAWPWALLFLILEGPTVLATALLATALALRVALHYCARAALDARSRDRVWLFPIRDLLGLAVWACSLFGWRVRWRDRDLVIDAQGRIVAAE